MKMVATTLLIVIGGPLLVVFVVLAGWAGWDLWQNRNDTFRYRLTVEVASGTTVYTGSGVIQVKMKIGGIVFSNVATPEVTGDAVVIEVPDHAPIFVLLSARNNVDWDAGIAFKVFRHWMPDQTGISTEQAFRQDTATLAHLREKVEIPPELYPTMAAFRDINRPASVYEVYPRSLSPPLDPGASIVAMTIEMTDAAVTEGTVARLLPWMGKMTDSYLDGSRLHHFDGSFANSLTSINFTKRGT